jgi:hypothetical protein
VQKTQKSDTKECFISINGAPVNSPPTEVVRLALANLAAITKRGEFAQPALGEIVSTLLIAAAPISKVPDIVRYKLTIGDASRRLSRCFEAFAKGDASAEIPKGRLEQDDFVCGMLAPYNNEESKHKSLDQFGAAVTSPTLAMSIPWQPFRFTLFIFPSIRGYGQ